MSANPTLFDLPAGRRAKERGMQVAAAHDTDLLEEVRAYLKKTAIWRGDMTASANDYDWYMATQHPGQSLGNAAGSLFLSKDWVCTGRWVQSRKKSNHARMIRVWRLK